MRATPLRSSFAVAALVALATRGYAAEEAPGGALPPRPDGNGDAVVLLAQAGGATAPVGDGSETPPGRRDDLVLYPSDPRSAGSGIRWRLAPLRWWGTVLTELRSFTVEGQERRFQEVESIRLNGASYVWQPWFAQVSGGIGAFTSKERGGGGSRSNNLTGNGKLDVFPSSRFPFQTYFDVSDSRSGDQFVGQEYRNFRYGVRQSYRPEQGSWTALGSYDRSTLSSPTFGRDTVDVVNASHTHLIDIHRFESSANLTRNSRQSGERMQNARLFGRHELRYDETSVLTMESLASYGTTDERLASFGALGQRRTDALQLNSFLTWQPDYDDPLHVTGGARFFSQSNETNQFGEFESRSIMAYGAANYRVNKNLLVNGGGSVAHTQSTATIGEDRTDVSTNQFAGASYTPDVRRFGEFVYNANLTANVSNQTGFNQSSRVMTTQGTHGVHRSFLLGPGQSLGAGLNQSLGASHNSVSGALYTLAHNAQASWSIAKSSALSGYVSASAGDSRTFGATNSAFHLVNVQISGQAQLSRFSSLTANMTMQGTRQESDLTAQERGLNVTTNGAVTYQHSRAFGMPRLLYIGSYSRSDYMLTSRLQGDLDAPRDLAQWTLDQRLAYRIGKLEASLQYRLAEFDGKKNALVFLRLARHIGDW